MKKRKLFLLLSIVILMLIAALYFGNKNKERSSYRETMNETTNSEEVVYVGGWKEENGNWYYIDETTGEKIKGWKTIEEKEYFFNPLSGIRWEGLLKLSEQEKYYFDEDGILLKNCQIENYVINEEGLIIRTILTAEEQEKRKVELQPVVDDILKKYGSVSAAIALIEDGEVSNTWEYGYAVKDSELMVSDTKIRIASITKVIVAMNILRLQDEGILNIEEDISSYWGFDIANPKYPDIPVTLKSILSHTSSIADAEGYTNIESRLKRNDVFRGVKPFSEDSYSYCNYAFAVGGSTMEKAANKTIYDISENYFFEPMGIDASFAGGQLENSELLASLYYHGGGLGRSKETMQGFLGHSVPGANGSFFPGGLCISAKDLAKMICILINDGVYQGNRYLSEEAVSIMEEPFCQADLHGAQVTQCFPLKYTNDIYGEDNLYFHTGSAYGVYSLFSYNPDTKNGVVVLTIGASGMCDNNGIYSVCGEISELLYQEANKLIVRETK